MSQPVEWKGYPVAQHQCDEVAEYRGYHLNVECYFYWGWRGHMTAWDAHIDDEFLGRYKTVDKAKQTCVNHADLQGDKRG